MGISSDVIRGYNDTIILYLILKEPSYGYEISKQIRTLSKEKYVIKETTLYSAFTRMEKNGFIESFSEIADSGKRRTYYRITDSGKEYYYEKCVEWELTKEVIEQFILQSAENSDGYAVRTPDIAKPDTKETALVDQQDDTEAVVVEQTGEADILVGGNDEKQEILKASMTEQTGEPDTLLDGNENQILNLSNQVADLEKKIAALEAQRQMLVRKGEEA